MPSPGRERSSARRPTWPRSRPPRRKDVTTAADVYGLGAVLYECLTGRPPFARRHAGRDARRRSSNREPARPRTIDPAVPRDLETVCLKCLEKDPARRYPTAAALADDLDRCLRGEPIQARPVGPAGRAWRWCRRNPAVAASVAMVALALIAGTAVSTWFGLRARRHATDADTARREAVDKAADEAAARLQATTELDRAEHLLYANQIALAQREWQTGNPPRALELLDASRADLRGWEWDYLHRLLHPDAPVLKGHREVVGHMAFSPDGHLLAAVGGYGHQNQPYFTRVWDVRTGQTVAAREGRGGAAVAYRPDLGLIATPAGDGLLLWDPNTGREVKSLKFGGSFDYRGRDGTPATTSFSGRGWSTSPSRRTARSSPPPAGRPSRSGRSPTASPSSWASAAGAWRSARTASPSPRARAWRPPTCTRAGAGPRRSASGTCRPGRS